MPRIQTVPAPKKSAPRASAARKKPTPKKPVNPVGLLVVTTDKRRTVTQFGRAEEQFGALSEWRNESTESAFAAVESALIDAAEAIENLENAESDEEDDYREEADTAWQDLADAAESLQLVVAKDLGLPTDDDEDGEEATEAAVTAMALPDAIQTPATITPMSATEARACVDEIKAHVETIRERLWTFSRRRGWEALGYASFKDSLTTEFQMDERRVYQLIDAYNIDRILADPSANTDCTIVQSESIDSVVISAPIPEGHARELAPLKDDPEAVREIMAEVTTEAKQKGGRVRAKDIKAAVDIRLAKPPRQGRMKVTEPTSEPDIRTTEVPVTVEGFARAALSLFDPAECRRLIALLTDASA